MGWVVTRWRTDRLAALLDEDARASARQLLWEAERDAERVRAAAVRETGSAAETLGAIERLGVELREGVRLYRLGEGTDPLAAAAPAEAKAPPLVPPEVAPRPRRRPRAGSRASLHDSPLAAMMRATAGR
ncbi:MAG TPA: hypothetical protein VF533_17725 [Solirubrobacteraceae bacterium]|jgi:hypothetical protein